MTGNVYAILGGRGDVGATTTAVALGASLSETSHRVAVVDADFEGEGIGAVLDIGDPDLTLRDVLRGDAELDEALTEAAHGLRVLPRGDSAPELTDVRSHALVRAADRVRERFDVVLLDLGAAAGAPAALALERADGAILASTPEDDAIAAVADAATVARYHGADVLGTAFTAIPEGTEIDHRAAADALGTDVLALVPEDDAVRESAAAGASLLRHDPDSPAAMVYWELAGRLADGDLGGDPVVHEPPAATADEQNSSSPPSQAQEDAGTREASSEPSVASAPEDAAEQSPASPDSQARRDAESHGDSIPVSTPSRQDAGEQSSPSPPSQAQEDAGTRLASSEPSVASAPEDADPRTASTGTASAGAERPTDDETDGASQNEFSWGDDPVDVETSDDDGGVDEAATSADGRSADTVSTDENPAAASAPFDGGTGREDISGDDREDETDEDDDIDAAFKATMDKVREKRENEADDENDGSDDDEDGNLFGIGG